MWGEIMIPMYRLWLVWTTWTPMSPRGGGGGGGGGGGCCAISDYWKYVHWSHSITAWKHFPQYWPFVTGIHWLARDSAQKGPAMPAFDIFFVSGQSKLLNKRIWRWIESQQWHPWWRHQMETFSASLVLCAGNSPVTGEFPSQRTVMRKFDVFFDLRLNKQLSKQ